jgi:excisionase family DNA binding protein
LTQRSSQRRDARRVTVSEAAALLGISKEAVRMRIRRGTLRSEKTDDRVYVWLDEDLNADQDAVRHRARDAGVADARDQLIEHLRSEVEAWREESRRKDHIIAGLVERLPPQLEPPREQPADERGATEMAADEQQGRGPIPDTPGPQEGSQRSWWRRLIGE